MTKRPGKGFTGKPRGGPALPRTDGYLGGEANGPDGVRNAVLDSVRRDADVIRSWRSPQATTRT
jgi:hypothetical protein